MKYTWLVGMVVLAGCAQKPESKGAWISVEKPPIRIVYMNKAETITPEMVRLCIAQAKSVPYKDYKFNESIKVVLDANSHQSSSITNVSDVDVKGTE